MVDSKSDKVIVLKSGGDNYIYLYIYESGKAFVVDPCESGCVLKVLKSESLTLTDILVTHHHFDHVGGVEELKELAGCRVIGGDGGRIPGIDRVVSDGDVLDFAGARVRVIGTPGHTRSSVCYYVDGVLFTGDTLFVNGCGRILECDAVPSVAKSFCSSKSQFEIPCSIFIIHFPSVFSVPSVANSFCSSKSKIVN